MKISNEPVTLSPKLSAYVRALAHASGIGNFDEVVEGVMFSGCPDNALEILAEQMGKSSPEYLRGYEAAELARESFEWEGFLKVAESMKPFAPADYASVTLANA